MPTLNEDSKLTIKILSEPKDIIKYLQIGISIPIWSEHQKYILHDLDYFKAKSFLLHEHGNPSGHVLIYDDYKRNLYFGYFGVLGHKEDQIKILIDEIITYAQKNKFKTIRGPINIPAVIYGWGFMKEGSNESLFAGKPVNPPIYQKLFLEKGFNIYIESKTWEGPILKFNPWKINIFDYTDYEYFNPKDLDEMMELKDSFLKINADNMPDTGTITPNIKDLLDNYLDYIFTYGYNFMIMFIRHIPTKKIIACGCCLPNPFRKDNRGNYDSLEAFSWAIYPEHRKKGLTLLMYGATSLHAWKHKMRYTAGPTGGEENKRFAKFAKYALLRNIRTHLILELKL